MPDERRRCPRTAQPATPSTAMYRNARDAAAGDGADAADDDDQQDLIGHGCFERHWPAPCPCTWPACAPPTPGEERGNDERQALVVGKVDAHGLGGDLVVADGLERAAVGRVDQQHDDGDDRCRQDHIRHGRRSARSGIALAEGCEPLVSGRERVPAGQRARMISAKPSVAMAR